MSASTKRAPRSMAPKKPSTAPATVSRGSKAASTTAAASRQPATTAANSASTRHRSKGGATIQASNQVPRSVNSVLAADTNDAMMSTAFDVQPQEVVFTSFVPDKTYETAIVFKNRTRQNQYLRVAPPSSRIFSVTPPKGSETTLKVAPGLDITYKVRFTPDETRDYACDLVVLTETEQFTIPVRAFSSRGQLDLPPELLLKECPVKSASSTSLFLRNSGTEPCQWRAVTDVPENDGLDGTITLQPSFGVVPPLNGVMPVEVRFAADALGASSGLIRFLLGPESDMVQDLPVRASSTQLSVALEQSSVSFQDTFVTTQRQAVVKVTNSSDETVTFSWKSDPTDAYERANIDSLVASRRSYSASASGPVGVASRSVNGGGGGGGTTAGAPVSGFSGSQLVREQEERLEANWDVARVFEDPSFSIEPSSGTIYGRGTREFTITFSPQVALECVTTAYLDITGKQERLPLQLIGKGIGPQCRLEYNKLNIGDIYMNAVHEYQIEFENICRIEARFNVLPSDTIMGQRFEFIPSEGVLAPGEVQTLTVRLQSDVIGVISETFNIHLHGCVEDLSLQFKGRVVGPTFQFDVDELDFGNVSYNFWHSRSFHITNTSQVPMNFLLHLPSGDRFLQDFRVEPSSAVIYPNESQAVQVDFLSNTVGEYDTALMVDIADVGTAVDSIPIKAACMVAPLILNTERLLFGHCFVGRDYTESIEVVNETAMSGKFELVLIGGDRLKGVAEVTIGNPERDTTIDILEPNDKKMVPITIRALSVGTLTFTLQLHVLGSTETMQTVLVTAEACGPNLELSTQSLNFGTINLLQSDSKTVTLENTSMIPAEVSVRYSKGGTGETSVFHIDPMDFVIEQHETYVMTVTARPDEAMTFADDLVITVKHSEGQVRPIALKVVGKGFALVPEIDIGDYNFGDIFTDTLVQHPLVIHNEGRKDQEVQWHNTRGTKVKEGAPPIVFAIKPERALIRSGEAAHFVMEGLSSEIGVFSDELFLKQSGSFKEMLRCKLSGNFIAPLIQYSQRSLNYRFVLTDPAAETVPTETSTFTMKNVTSMDLNVILKIRDAKSAFSLEGPTRFPLASGETKVVGVVFNPAYRGDRTTHDVKNKVVVSFADHSYTETINLAGDIHFPGVELTPPGDLDFGTIMRDTEDRRVITIKNASNEIPATFTWKIVNAAGELVTPGEAHAAAAAAAAAVAANGGAGDAAATNQNANRSSEKRNRSASRKGTIKKAKNTNSNGHAEEDDSQPFDFVPFQGVIAPGQSCAVDVAFFGNVGLHEISAVCEVLGGPSYPIKLRAASGDVAVNYDRTALDFGIMPYYATSKKTITISNPSKVPVEFRVNTFSLKFAECLKISPLTGVIAEKQVFEVVCSPIVPDEINEVFSIQVGQFDPQPITVKCKGQLNSVTFAALDSVSSVSRVPEQAFQDAMAEVKQSVEKEGRALVPYFVRTSNLPVPSHYNRPMEQEAERLAFCRGVKTQREQVRLAQATGSSRTSSVAAIYPTRREMRRNSATANSRNAKYVLSHYMVDFGNMTRNDVRSTRIQLINTSPESLFLMLDSRELNAIPVTVTPFKIPKLEPVGVTTLTIELDARREEEGVRPLKPGENLLDFTFDIKEGPAVVISCRCFIETPTLTLSDPSLDFGEVILGQVKVMPLTLKNDQSVPCEWRLSVKDLRRRKKTSQQQQQQQSRNSTVGGAVDGAAGADAAPEEDSLQLVLPPSSSVPLPLSDPQFWASQERGTLLSGESITIEVYFAPHMEDKLVSSLNFRYVSNPTVYDVKCYGFGRRLKVVINPAPLVFTSVRPYQLMHQLVKITNHEDEAVELFNYNLDGLYKNELDILSRALTTLDAKHLLLPIPAAGDSLPDELVEYVYETIDAEQTALTVKDVDLGDADEDNQQNTSKKAPKAKKRSTTPRGSKIGSVVKDTAAMNVKADPALALRNNFFLVVGPPQAGCTTQSRLLAKKLDLTFVSFDQLVTEESQRDTAYGEVIRCLLSSQREALKLALPAAAAAANINNTMAAAGTVVDDDLPSAFSVDIDALLRNGLPSPRPPASSSSGGAGAGGALTTSAGAPTPTATSDAPEEGRLVSPFELPPKTKSQQGYHNNSGSVQAPSAQGGVAAGGASTSSAGAAAVGAASNSATPRDNKQAGADPNGAATTNALGLPVMSGAGASSAEPSAMSPEKLASYLPAMLRDLLAVHIRQDAAGKPRKGGLIMDGLSCCLTPDRGLLYQAVKDAVAACAVPYQVLSIGVSESVAGLRYARRVLAAAESKTQAAHVDTLSEDEYALLDKAERNEYNRQLKYYNECKRALRVARAMNSHFESRSAEAGQATVQAAVIEKVQEEKEKGEQRASRGSRSKSNAKNGSGDGAAAGAVDWSSLSLMDAFKHFFEIIAREDQPAEPAKPTKSPRAIEAPPPLPLHQVNGEKPSDVVALSVLDVFGLATPNVPPLGGSLLGASGALPSPSTATNDTGSGQQLRSARSDADQSMMDSEGHNGPVIARPSFVERTSHIGTWNYVDPRRLEYTRMDAVDNVRFFSFVERETIVAAKKGAKAKGPTVTRQYEEITRWVVPPKSVVRVLVEYCCSTAGDHESRCLFGFRGSLQTAELLVRAHAALPDIARDEKLMFPVVRTRAIASKPATKVFLTSKNLYDFGPILVAGPSPANKPRRKSNPDRSNSRDRGRQPTVSVEDPSQEDIYSASETIRFTNSEAATAEITFTFANEKEKTFTVTPNKLMLEPGSTQEVVLRAAPESVGELANQLIVSIRDNPEPYVISVCCVGSKPSLTMNGEKELEVDFGRSVINRREVRTVMLANISSMPLRWRLVGAEKLPPEIMLSSSEGSVDNGYQTDLELTFAPSNTCLHDLPLQLEVFDGKNPAVVYETLPLTVKAEGHDVVLEWTREVDFRLMHVGETRRELIRIMNKSPYDVGYRVRVPKRLQNLITLSNNEGTIRGMVGYKDSAIVNVEVTVRFDKEGEIHRKLGFLETTFFDVEKEELYYPVQQIPVSGEAWYTHFKVKPTTMDFGSCFYQQKKQASFDIQNTGRFPVNFQLFNFPEGCAKLREAEQTFDDEDDGPAALKKSVRGGGGGGAGGAGGNNHKTDAEFKIGCYSVSPARGCVEVGETLTVNVTCVPTANARTAETLGIFVELADPVEHANGCGIELNAHPSTPGIAGDLSMNGDVETVFEEQQIVYRLDQFDPSTRAYGKEDRTFCYGTSLVGHTTEERFRVANSSSLPCGVNVSLQSASVSKNASKPDGFCIVDPDSGSPVYGLKLSLPAFESRFVTVRFSPTALQRFEARFVANVESINSNEKQSSGASASQQNQQPSNLAFSVVGYGTLPHVQYELPPQLYKPSPAATAELKKATAPPPAAKKNKKGNAAAAAAAAQALVAAIDDIIQLPYTLVGEHSAQTFSVHNKGSVPADVRITMTSDESLAQGLSFERRNTDINIAAGCTEEFTIEYNPQTVARSVMKLTVSIADNPFEKKELVVEAQSFAQVISFHNIDPAASDFVDLADCYLNEATERVIGIQNNSESDVRFSWAPAASDDFQMEITPSIGHLAPGASKELLVRLTCFKTAAPQRAACQVSAQSIEMIDSAAEWDNSMVNQKWVAVDENNDTLQSRPTMGSVGGRRNLKKVLEPVPEPAFRATSAVQVSQNLFVGYHCEVPSYEVNVVDNDGQLHALGDVLTFETTKLFQHRIVTLRLMNHSAVGLPFNLRAVDPDPPAFTGGDDYAIGFSVEPASGTVAAKGSLDVSVIFAPRIADSCTRLLVGDFPFSTNPHIELPLVGTGECPLVHFQIPPSTYLETRIDGEAGHLENTGVDDKNSSEGLAVLEFLTRGLHTKAKQTFKVTNPTATGYQYEWVDQAPSGALSPFRCLTPSGSIGPGKQADMTFEFCADTLGTRESRWAFSVVGKESVPFLLVGKAVEPDVMFTTSKVNFGPVSVGVKQEMVVHLENRDDVPFSFNFSQDEMSEGGGNFLTVKPMSGTIGAKEKLPVTIVFAPKEELEYNIPLQCNVKRATTPLSINIKGEGVMVHETLVVEAKVGDKKQTHHAVRGQPLLLQLGRIQVNDTAVRRFILSNTGQHPFDFTVSAPNRRFMTLEGATGTIAAKQRSVVVLTYSPQAEEVLRDYRLQIRINGKSYYQISVQATTYIPRVAPSFDHYDFGACFITQYNPNGELSTVLTVANHDKEMVSVDCALSDDNDWCTIDRTSFVARPNEVNDIKIAFHPREARVYEDKLCLTVNGVHPIYIGITGEGTVPRVEALNHFAKFGACRIGEKRQVEVKIESRGKVPTPVSFTATLDSDLISKGVSMVTPQTMLLKPREVRSVVLAYKPTYRTSEFQREVKMLVCGKEFPFVLIGGACEDAEIHVDNSHFDFHDVVIGSSSTRRLVVMNSGDIAQKFTINGLKQGGELRALPASGFVRPHTEQVVELQYRPARADSVVKNKVVSLDFDASPSIPIYIDATAMRRPPAKGTVRFSCKARDTVTQKVTVENSTTETWQLEPSIDQTVWSIVKAPPSIKPKGKADIEIMYQPTKPTTESDFDVGTLFLPQPNGAGVTYTLEGHADAPGPAAPPVELQVEARAPGTAHFTIKNWSLSKLRFTREVVWSSKVDDGVISLKGPSVVEVPPSSSKEVALEVSALREGVYRGTVRYISPERPDLMQYFELVLKVSGQSMTESTSLHAEVRTSVTHTIVLANPLAKTVTATCKLDNNADVLTVPPTIALPAKSATNLVVEFFPLVHKTYQPSKLVVSSSELGASTYVFNLSSSPCGLEKPTTVHCPIGQTATFTLRFTHYCKTNTDFAVKIGGEPPSSKGTSPFSKLGQGTGVKALAAPRPKGQELTADFSFEPESLGVLKETIEFISPAGGTYSFPIIATCTEPQRQGPFTIKSGSNTSVPFRNVFHDPVTITVTMDNPAFTVAKRTETVPAKKSINITVQCKLEEAGQVERGRMMVSCVPPSQQQQNPRSGSAGGTGARSNSSARSVNSTAPGSPSVVPSEPKEPLEWVYYLECGKDGSGGSNSARGSRKGRK